MATLFNFCDASALEDEDNRNAFVSGGSTIYIPSQSNDPACDSPLCNIEKICKALTTGDKDPLQRVADVSKTQHYGQCLPVNANSTLDFYAQPHNPSRAWEYQTCRNFGFYQTCEKGSECIYTRGSHYVNKDLNICETVFGMDAATVYANVEETNEKYFNRLSEATRVMYVNGEVDPWHGLSQLTPLNDETPVLMVTGSSHHAWTHPSAPTDSKWLVEARQAIWDQIKTWLASA